MRTMFRYMSVMFILIAGHSPAQDLSGTVTYQQITKLDLETVFDDEAMTRMTQYFGGELPEARTGQKVLTFDVESALFESGEQESADPILQRITMHMEIMRPPRPKLEKIFYDFKKNEKIEQVEFMTRYFRIANEIENPAWKLTNKSTNILDYTCMGAELKRGDESIIAYFTSEIPVALGPGDFIGLPGLVLAVEKNSETVYLATFIDLTPPEKDIIAEPKDGKKITQEEFDNILKEKIEEYKETQENEIRRRNNPHRGR